MFNGDESHASMVMNPMVESVKDKNHQPSTNPSRDIKKKTGTPDQ